MGGSGGATPLDISCSCRPWFVIISSCIGCAGFWVMESSTCLSTVLSVWSYSG